MPTLTVNLGVGAASDDVYLIVYEDDTYAACWDGDSWEIPSALSFDLGGVAGVHQGDGVFTFEFPASITEPGTYPVRVFEYPGIVGSYTPDDPQLTYDSPLNVLTIFPDGSSGELTPHQCYWSSLEDHPPRNQIRHASSGTGRPIKFSRKEGETAVTGTYRFDVSTLTNPENVIFSVTGVLNAGNGDILANPTIAQYELLDRNQAYLGRLWRTDGDDNTDIISIVIISVN